MCEAEVYVPSQDTWVRCGAWATEVHHLLPRSRGGKVLDEVGEMCHLLHLCRTDHALAHARSDAEEMMIDGSVTWDNLRERPVYRGTDKELTRKYGLIVG